ncbi:UNVERIFIED_ORG: aconitate hydratase AcnA [Shinella sp. XGS7]|nr:aconitate hydratase AcnA [Shinella sp. XGS7]
MPSPQHAFAETLSEFSTASGRRGAFYSLPRLAQRYPNVKRLPVSLRIVLESVLRNCDGQKVAPEHVAQLANWAPNAARNEEIPFVVARVVLQDFTGVPLLTDLAAMRNVAAAQGKNPKAIEPLVPVDLVVDHSVMIDHYGNKRALDLNMKLEYQRNGERYRFLKWGQQAFQNFRVVPPGTGICHQVNLEYLGQTVWTKEEDGEIIAYPDTCVGTDSHTTMINGLGVLGWGVGGIEAEAAMLGQPVSMLLPEVIGFKLTGKLKEGVTATDLVLTVTEILRQAKVVGKFVEFFGEGTESLSVPDRATIANMAPEYGATMGFFPVDDKTLDYFRGTGRTGKEIEAFEAYFKAQELFGIPKAGEIDYSAVIKLDLGTVAPSLAGPKRPQDRIEIGHLSSKFSELFSKPVAENGFNQPAEKLGQVFKTTGGLDIRNGDVLIAAITSCTNTSNPSVLIAAGLLARNAVAKGLKTKPWVKTSLAPGSQVVGEYLAKSGLQADLDKLGFNLVGFGCTTCIGNSGPLPAPISKTINDKGLIAAGVLSGNRNFEGRISPDVQANYLASPPLVVAYALAGNVTVDLMTQPVGLGKKGKPIYLGDIWPTSEEVYALMKYAMNPKAFKQNYEQVDKKPGKLWQAIKGVEGQVYNWPQSTYIAQPPFFHGFTQEPVFTAAGVQGARVLGLFGDKITTDHISPAGSIKAASPAGAYLTGNGVAVADFNQYGTRRGNHEVMMRGTFANIRIRNHMLGPNGKEGGYTIHYPSKEEMSIYDAAMKYKAEGVPLVIFAGVEYGNGSSRDWAAKGTNLLGVKAVVAQSFERIHRSNLVGMGVVPLQFKAGDSWESLGLKGDELIDIRLEGALKPQREATLVVTRADGSRFERALILRIDTPIEVEYYRHGGILPFVLRQLLAA